MDLKIASHILLLDTWGHSELNCSLFGLSDFIHSHRFYYENVMRVFEYNKRVWISTAIVKTRWRPYSRHAGTGFVEIFPRVRSTDVLPARTPNSIFLATYVFIIKFVTRLARPRASYLTRRSVQLTSVGCHIPSHSILKYLNMTHEPVSNINSFQSVVTLR